MADNSKIEWTDATWGPVVGCSKVSPGCDNCYAETLVNRFAGTSKAFPNRFDVVTLRPWMLHLPIKWQKPRRVFVNSLADLFHDDVPDNYIVRVFSVMAVSARHTFQVLTKRHGRMRSLLSDPAFPAAVMDDARAWAIRGARVDPVQGGWPLRNVWLGVSVEDQKWADIRVPALLDTPAAVRFLSCEPLLGPLDLTDVGGISALDQDWTGGPTGGTGAPHPLVDWVIVGGESGHGARPMDLAWVRQIRDDCEHAAVPFLFKQVGGRTSKAGGRELDGRTYDEYPREAVIGR